MKKSEQTRLHLQQSEALSAHKQTYPMTRKVWFPYLSSRLAHASWDDRVGEFSSEAQAAEQTSSLLLLLLPLLLRSSSSRLALEAVKVTGRCLIVSTDNLMYSICLLTQLLRSHSSPSRARCTTTPTTGSALQKGPAQGVLPPPYTALQRRHRETRALRGTLKWTGGKTCNVLHTGN